MPRKIAERTVVRLAGEYAARFPHEAAEELSTADRAAAAEFVGGLATSTAVATICCADPETTAAWFAEMTDEALRRIAPRTERKALEGVAAAADAATRQRLERALEPDEPRSEEV